MTAALLLGADESRIELWDVEASRFMATIPLSKRMLLEFSLSADGRLLALSKKFKADGSDLDRPSELFLYDARTGEPCDRLELPPLTAGWVRFRTEASVLEVRETTYVARTDQLTGLKSYFPQLLIGAKFFDFTDTPRFQRPKLALNMDSQGTSYVVNGPRPKTVQIESADGATLCEPFDISDSDSLSGPQVIPGTDFLVARERQHRSYPAWAWQTAGRLGITWFNDK